MGQVRTDQTQWLEPNGQSAERLRPLEKLRPKTATSRLPCMYVSATNVHEHNVHEHNVHEIKICIYVRRPVPRRVRSLHYWGPFRLPLGRSRQGAATSRMQRSAHAATLLADCNLIIKINSNEEATWAKRKTENPPLATSLHPN